MEITDLWAQGLDKVTHSITQMNVYLISCPKELLIQPLASREDRTEMDRSILTPVGRPKPSVVGDQRRAAHLARVAREKAAWGWQHIPE